MVGFVPEVSGVGGDGDEVAGGVPCDIGDGEVSGLSKTVSSD